ncbi:MAG: hypothetical protein CMJ65_05895 [Planctomycetaceae bacterium]|nr:hypothetical protein [Planctomycetaceae bacterium]
MSQVDFFFESSDFFFASFLESLAQSSIVLEDRPTCSTVLLAGSAARPESEVNDTTAKIATIFLHVSLNMISPLDI